MKKFNEKQQGMTFMGLLFLLAAIALVVLLVLRVYPLYYEKFQVVNAMKSVASRANAFDMQKMELENAFLKQITATTNIRRFNRKNIREYMNIENAKKNRPRRLIMQYEIQGPFFQEIELVMHFNEEFPIN